MNAIASPYNDAPGFKEPTTSAEAAAIVEEDAATLRGRCLELVKLRGDMTADEAATMMDKSVLAIRPRFTELFKLGWIYKSGMRRKNASGISATVWTCDPQSKLL